VLAIWGFGFVDRSATPEQATELIDFFKNNPDERYRVTLVGGVPARWRTLARDSQPDPRWASVYRSFDVLSPWTVGRFRDNDGIDRFYADEVTADRQETQRLGIEYLPVVFPGFSWHNMNPAAPFNRIPRRGGRFYWRQVERALGTGNTMLYGAMFDEVDEGTAIFKTAASRAEVPAEVPIVTLDVDGETLPSDWYLRLAREAQRQLQSDQRTEWPDFRGPDGQGHSEARNLPIAWSEQTNIAWKTAVPGAGWSTPILAHGRIWMTTAVDGRESSLRVVALDEQTGREVVNTEVFKVRNGGEVNPKNNRASPSAVADDERIYVHFGAEGTAALTVAGDIVWKARFTYESQHGAGGSPIVFGDLLIINCDGGDNAFVVALDKRTGKVRWRTSRRYPYAQAYSTPLAIRANDRDQIVSVGAFRAVAYDPTNGKEIWRVSYGDGFSNVPRPVFGQGLVYIATGFQQPALIAVRPEGTGDLTRSQVAWTLTRGAPLTPSPLLVGSELYVVSDAGIATCVDAATGTIRWQQRLNGTFSASPVYADGRIYFLSEQGVTTVIAPGPDFRTLATNTLDGETLASMAVSSQAFFIRSRTHLYRIQQPRRE
jgi:outer membrane protein assembly factor BamB